MFHEAFVRAAMASAIVASLAGFTGSAAFAGQLQQTSSSVWWSAAGDHADLVVAYDSRATVPLTVKVAYVLDAGGYGVSQVSETCGTGVKTGDAITSYTLRPGQYCWIRAFRGSQQDEIVGKAILGDATASNTNIQQFVRSSLEVRDGSDNVLTHVEVR